MTINKNLKLLFQISKFLSKFLWLYFVFIAFAALMDTEHYLNGATQATLLISCIPLMFLKDFHNQRELEKIRSKNDDNFLKMNAIIPATIVYGGIKYVLEEIIGIEKWEGDKNSASLREILRSSNTRVVIAYKQPYLKRSFIAEYKPLSIESKEQHES